MTREEAKHYLSVPSSTNGSGRCTDEQHYEAKQIAIKALSQEPCDDVVSRQAIKEVFPRWKFISYEAYLCSVLEIDKLPSVKPQEPKTGQFAEWVAREIFDDMWEYNKDAFAEIACRKLAKLGIVREKGNEWELVEQQESEG